MSQPKLGRNSSIRERVEDIFSAHRNELVSLLSRFLLSYTPSSTPFSLPLVNKYLNNLFFTFCFFFLWNKMFFILFSFCKSSFLVMFVLDQPHFFGWSLVTGHLKMIIAIFLFADVIFNSMRCKLKWENFYYLILPSDWGQFRLMSTNFGFLKSKNYVLNFSVYVGEDETNAWSWYIMSVSRISGSDDKNWKFITIYNLLIVVTAFEGMWLRGKGYCSPIVWLMSSIISIKIIKQRRR